MNPPDILVFAVAGLGKRLRPLTPATPKNLVPVNGRPLIDYHVAEAAASGFSEIVIITSPADEAKFRDYLSGAAARFPRLTFSVCIQEQQLGDGHALLQAADIVGDRPCIMRFPDDLVLGKRGVLSGLKEVYASYGGPVVLLQQVPHDQVYRYGVVAANLIKGSPDIYSIYDVVEKPSVEEAPSDLIIIGGYVITPNMFFYLKEIAEGRLPKQGDELRIVDAFRAHLADKGALFGWKFPGRRLDCGTLDGLAEAEAVIKTTPSAF